MQLIDSWLKKKYLQQERFVSLQDGLLDKNIYPYAAFRFRYFSLNMVIVLAVHLIEFLLISLVFSEIYFVDLILLRSFSLLIKGGWWGSLEIFRTRIRYFDQEGRRDLIKQEIGNWVILASLLAAAAGFLALHFMLADFPAKIQGQADLFNLYRVVIILQIATQLVVRTFHEGAYSLKRIARPLLSISIADLIAVLLSVVFWPFWGPVSLPIALLCSSVVAAVLTFYYTTRTYRLLHLLPIPFPDWLKFKKFIQQLPSLELVAASIGGMARVVDGFVIAILLKSNIILGAGLHLGLLLYLLIPLIRSSYEWSSLFYFDLKFLHRKLLADFQKFFQNQLLQIAKWVSIPLWLLATIIALSYVGQSLVWFCLLLLPFLMVNSMFGFLQLKCFVNQYYWDVAISGGCLLIVTLLGGYFIASLYLQLAIITLYLGLACLYLKNPNFLKVQSLRLPRGNLGICPWLSELMAIKQSVRIHRLRLNASISTQHSQLLIARLSDRLRREGGITQLGNEFIFCYQVTFSAVSFDPKVLIELGCGMICEYKSIPFCKDGLQAFINGHRAGLFNEVLPAGSLTQATINKSVLLNDFQKSFPNGIFFRPLANNSGSIAAIPKELKRRFLKQAQLFIVAPSSQDSHLEWWVFALYEQGSIETIFALPKSDELETAAYSWMQTVQYYNVNNIITAAKVLTADTRGTKTLDYQTEM